MGFVSVAASFVLALGLLVWLFINPGTTYAGEIVGIVGGVALTGKTLGNLSSILHTFINSKIAVQQMASNPIVPPAPTIASAPT